jgi:hypothetical protein
MGIVTHLFVTVDAGSDDERNTLALDTKLPPQHIHGLGHRREIETRRRRL